MSHEKSDLVIFDRQGQPIGLIGTGMDAGTETKLSPAPKLRFSKDPNATVLDETYEIDGTGKMRFRWQKMITKRQAIAIIVVFVIIVLFYGLISKGDHEKRMADFQSQIDDRTARGCKYKYPGVSPDGGENPDIGCRPASPTH